MNYYLIDRKVVKGCSSDNFWKWVYIWHQIANFFKEPNYIFYMYMYICLVYFVDITFRWLIPSSRCFIATKNELSWLSVQPVNLYQQSWNLTPMSVNNSEGFQTNPLDFEINFVVINFIIIINQVLLCFKLFPTEFRKNSLFM